MRDSRFAIGSGDQCALVAMSCGLTSPQAVVKAMEFATGCFGKIETCTMESDEITTRDADVYKGILTC